MSLACADVDGRAGVEVDHRPGTLQSTGRVLDRAGHAVVDRREVGLVEPHRDTQARTASVGGGGRASR